MRSITRVVPLLATATGIMLLHAGGTRAQTQGQPGGQAQQGQAQTSQAQGATPATSQGTDLNAQLSPLKDLVRTTANELTWGDRPAGLPPGAKAAAVVGDPAIAGKLFTVRFKMPAGYKIMPHWHPTDEHVTVLSGSFAMGHGDTFDPKQMKTLPVGGYAAMPAGHHHFAMAQKETVIQLHGLGPFAITYVNPADDPRNQPERHSSK